MIAAFDKGDVEQRPRASTPGCSSPTTFETSDLTPNPMPAKAMMRVLGLPAGECRLPIGPAPDGLEDRAARCWRNASVA